MHRLIPFMGTPKPPLPVTNVALLLDPSNSSVSSGKISQFNDAPVTAQADVSKRAAYVASYSEFKNKPAAYFESIPGSGAHNFYPLGNLSALTEGEIFAVLRMRYGMNENWLDSNQSGLWHLSGSGLATHYTYPDYQIWDGTGTNTRWTYNNTAFDFIVDAPHILNIRVNSGGYLMYIDAPLNNNNDQLVHGHTGFSVSFPSSAFLGKHGSYDNFFNGWLGFMAVCSTYQTTPARAAMMTYLRNTYIPTV